MSSNLPSVLGIHVNSGPYADGIGQDFDLFESGGGNPHRVSVVFGHNGSGKSTIAREISSIAKGEDTGYLYDSIKGQLSLSENERNRVRVFNEDYIRDKVLLEEDGLQTIVMLGDQADAKVKIAKIDEQIESASKDIETLENRKSALEEGPSSIGQLESDAKDAIKNGGWSSRGQSIKHLGSKMSLTAARWSSILKSTTTEPRNKVERQYQAKFEIYQKAQASDSLIGVKLNHVSFTAEEEAELTNLLKRTLDKPVLSDREQRILALVRGGYQHLVEEAREMFSSDETTVCPMCQQDVSPEYKESLEASIVKVLSKEADEYKAQLQAVSLPSIREEEVPEQVSGDARAAYATACAKAEKLVQQYSALIKERTANLYIPLNETPRGLLDAVLKLNNAVSAINAEIDSINEAFRNREKMEDELLKLSDIIARIDAQDKIKLVNKAISDLEDIKERLCERQSERERLQSEKAVQEARLKQVSIAAGVINRYLAGVYFDDKRFRLIPSGDKYAVQSRGKPVRPTDISTGERNVLALCYFFSEGGKNKRKGAEDADSQYIVLDDPVSSFDMENRVGICSLIRERAAHILGSNPDSRITVFTHDAGVVSELKHTFDDVALSTGKTFAIDYLDLTRNGTKQHSIKLPEYTALLFRAYEFASSQNEDQRESLVIGNILRRILEGYGSFNYGMGMAEISRDTELCKRFGADLTPMLESVMYRLELNDESHMQERMSSLNPPLNFSRYSYDEKRACAQCVLIMALRCF